MRWWFWRLFTAIDVIWPITDSLSGVEKELIWAILIFPLDAVRTHKKTGAVVRDRVDSVRAEIRFTAFPVDVGRRFAPVGFG